MRLVQRQNLLVCWWPPVAFHFRLVVVALINQSQHLTLCDVRYCCGGLLRLIHQLLLVLRVCCCLQRLILLNPIEKTFCYCCCCWLSVNFKNRRLLCSAWRRSILLDLPLRFFFVVLEQNCLMLHLELTITISSSLRNYTYFALMLNQWVSKCWHCDHTFPSFASFSCIF